MPRLLITLLMMLLLTSCAAQTAMTPYDRAVADGYLVPPCPKQVLGEPPKSCQPPPFRPSMNLGQAVTDLATIPLRLPEAMISSYPAGRVTCRTSTYKDQVTATCR
jgi:hypothetical protein